MKALSPAALLGLTVVAVAGVGLAVSCRSSTGPEPPTLYVDVDAGDFHTCAVSADGATLCWGYNPGRFFNPSSSADSTRPIPVDGDPGFRRVMAGSGFDCGLTDAGRVYCWGRNERGQLGDGTSGADRPGAGPVAGTLRFSELGRLSGTNGHACALSMAGTAYCWGNNWRRQLGAGRGVDSLFIPVPTPVAANRVFAMVAAGAGESCGITLVGDLYCWGADASGLRDLDPGNDRESPAPIAAPVPFETIAVGSAVVCGLAPDGRAYCRGWNAHGMLGTGDTVSSAVFQPVDTDLRFQDIDAGSLHACALTGDGTAYCWGWGDSGRLGNGSSRDRLVPTAVAVGIRFQKVSAGGNHTCALAESGEIYCWGSNFYGQLGTGDTRDSDVPVAVAAPGD